MQWYDTELEEEDQQIMQTLERFLSETVSPYIKDHERSSLYPADILGNMGKLGFMGVTIPEGHEGFGRSTLFSSRFARELAYCWPSLHLIWSVNTSLSALPILLAGSEQQKREVLPELAQGKIFGCYALTEPGAGSDVSAMTLTAKWEDKSGGWILNGTKCFISGAFVADFIVLFARTGTKAHDITAFLIRKNDDSWPAGLTLQMTPKHSLRCSPFYEIFFQDVRIPHDCLLGVVGGGFKTAMQTLDAGRLSIASQAVGIAAHSFDEALEYMKLRKQFGRPIWEISDLVRSNFACWFADLHAAWALIEKASRMRDENTLTPAFASATKRFATETAKRVCTNAAECMGGSSVSQDLLTLQRVLDIWPTTIYEGTTNIQDIVIAKAL